MSRVHTNSSQNWFQKMAKMPLAIVLLAMGFLVSPPLVQTVDAGKSSHVKKRIGGGHSGGYRISRSSKQPGISSRKMIKKNRTYVKRRSVLDGGYQRRHASGSGISSRQLYHRPVRGQYRDRGHGVKRYGKRLDSNRHYSGQKYRKDHIYSSRLSGDGVLSDGVSRSGVKYISRKKLRTNRGYRGNSNFREIAGNGSTYVVKRRLQPRETTTRRVATGFSNSGLIVIGVGTSGGLQEIAGTRSGDSGADCEYGTYCTIDLGGPKIITFNDAGDIRGGELSDDDLTDEEYLQKYGTK